MNAPTNAVRAKRERKVGDEAPAIYGGADTCGNDEAVLARAEEILAARFAREGHITCQSSAARFLRSRLAHLEHEEFHAVWLDTRHGILGVECLSRGTIDAATIHVREVVKAALRANAAAVIFAHNHPSGNTQPSAVDRAITIRLRSALELVDVRLVDHFVVGAGEPASCILISPESPLPKGESTVEFLQRIRAEVGADNAGKVNARKRKRGAK